MRALRKFFAGYFVAVAVISSLTALLPAFAGRFTMSIGSFVSTLVLLLISLVWVMAGWTSWMDKPMARLWGICASLLIIAIPLILKVARHRPIASGRLVIVILGVCALIAYALPDREGESA